MRPDRTSRCLSIVLFAMLLAGCGPDTAPLLADATAKAAASRQCLGTNDFAGALSAWQAVAPALGEDLTAKAADGRTLEAHLADLRSALAADLTGNLGKLAGAIANRDGLGSLDRLIDAAGLAGNEAWKTARSGIDARLVAAEKAAAEAQAKAEAERRDRAYLMYLRSDPTSNDNRQILNAIAKAIEARAPHLPIIVCDKQPAADAQGQGTIALSLAWDSVSYESDKGFQQGRDIPVALVATLVVASKSPASWDGSHELRVKKDTPGQVNLRQLAFLRSSQVGDLQSLLVGRLGKDLVVPAAPAK